MTENYILRKVVLAAVPEVRITAEEFTELASARITLTSAFAIEEKYEVLISNYLALESALLARAATDMIRSDLDYRDFFDGRMPLTVCMVNLLTATKLYLDQVPQDIRECLGGDKEANQRFKDMCSAEYNAHFEYRFMEALRNHVQHRALPIGLTRHHGGWIEGQDSRIEFLISIYALKESLAANGEFKASVLNEMTNDVDLKAAARRYVESLSHVHAWVRRYIDQRVSEARRAVETAHATYESAGADNVLGLSAIALADDGVTHKSSVPLSLEWDDVRIRMIKRNAKLVNLSKRYATSR